MMHKLELMLNMVATDAGIKRLKFAYSAHGSQADESDRYYVRGDTHTVVTNLLKNLSSYIW